MTTQSASYPLSAQTATITLNSLGTSTTALGITAMGDCIFRDSLPQASVIPSTTASGMGWAHAARGRVLPRTPQKAAPAPAQARNKRRRRSGMGKRWGRRR